MNWLDLHKQSKVVDLHNHAVLKRFLLTETCFQQDQVFSRLFKRAFWPLVSVTFPLLDDGDIDVVLSTCYIPEEWLEDQTLVKWALALSQKSDVEYSTHFISLPST